MVAAPLSDEELMLRADLVGYARVLSRHGHRVRLRFTKILKGRPRGDGLLHRIGLSRTVDVVARGSLEPYPMMLGDWSDIGAYVPGRRIKAHLMWEPDQNAYAGLWWNAISRC